MSTPTVPIVTVESHTIREDYYGNPVPDLTTHSIVIKRSNGAESSFPGYSIRAAAERDAANIRGALADAFLAGRNEAEVAVHPEALADS